MPLLSMNSRALPAFLVLPTPFSSAFSAAHMHPALVTQDSPSDHAVFHFSACLPFLVKTREPMLLHPSCQRVRHRRFGDGRKRTALIFHLHYGFFCARMHPALVTQDSLSDHAAFLFTSLSVFAFWQDVSPYLCVSPARETSSLLTEMEERGEPSFWCPFCPSCHFGETRAHAFALLIPCRCRSVINNWAFCLFQRFLGLLGLLKRLAP
jgi:hypothetical protein